jgi:hypothetical protein
LLSQLQAPCPTSGRSFPTYLFCYHKVGTFLLKNCFERICAEFGWRYREVYGKCNAIPDDGDVILFPHSQVDLNLAAKPYVGVHFYRDPRDVIVSGYLYHKRCNEAWCVNTNFDAREPILYPRVPTSQQHRPEEWKRRYLASLEGKSYQQNLLDRDQDQGLLFEMRHYAEWTIETMLTWNYHNPSVLEVPFETVMSRFDDTFLALFEHFGLSESQTARALEIAVREDLGRMSDRQLAANTHISSRKITKWREYFRDTHKNAFRQQFGNALVQLGYEASDNW